MEYKPESSEDEDPYRGLIDEVNQKSAIPKELIERQARDSFAVKKALENVRQATLSREFGEKIEEKHGLTTKRPKEILFPFGYSEDLVDHPEEIPEIQAAIDANIAAGWNFFGATISPPASRFKDVISRRWVTKEKDGYIEWQTVCVGNFNVHFKKVISKKASLGQGKIILDKALKAGWEFSHKFIAGLPEPMYSDKTYEWKMLSLGEDGVLVVKRKKQKS